MASEKGVNVEKWIEENNPYMTLDEIKSLHNDGFLIGAHSVDHPEFYKIPFDEQYKQIEVSMNWVNKHINPALKAFAFPYTDDGISNKLLEKAKEQNILDISLGTAGLKHDVFPTHFQRIPMEPKSLNTAHQIFKYEHFYFNLRAILGGNTVRRN
jgi:peptidoglycan/xylan/chitin deacetylase (PgdA/CDA1 family)